MGFLSTLFGGSQQKEQQSSLSDNTNKDLINSQFGGTVTNGQQGNNYLSSLLTGTGDTGAANKGYQNYLQMAGYAPAMKQLSENLTGQGAASGLLNSGTTTKALQSSGAALNNQFANNYLQQLAGLSGLGLGAGQLELGAGQHSTSQGTSSGSNNTGLFGQMAGGGTGAGNLLSLGASIFSDRRLKTEIEHIGTEPDGLHVYSFRYLTQATKRFVGVMADEVARLRPWALGPIVEGYRTVNYGAL